MLCTTMLLPNARQLVQRLRWDLALEVTLSALPFLTVLNLRIGIAPTSDEKEVEQPLRVNMLGAQFCTKMTLVEDDSLWMSIYTAEGQVLNELNLYAAALCFCWALCNGSP